MSNRSFLSRRRFLCFLGYLGGAGAVYDGLTSLGLLPSPVARAQTTDPDDPHNPNKVIVDLPADFGKGFTVAVIGAGPAGLCAAYELAKGGFDVTVFEATSRLGGRTLTVRPGDRYQELPTETNRDPTEQVCVFEAEKWVDGSVHVPYLNAGAGRIPHHHVVVLEYCRRLGVRLESYILASRANLIQHSGYNGGKPIQFRELRHNIRGYISELLANVPDISALDTAIDPELLNGPLRKLLQDFGQLDDSFLYPDPTPQRAGFAIPPGAGIAPTASGKPRKRLDMKEILEHEVWKTNLYSDMRYYWQTSLMQPVDGMDQLATAFSRARVPISGHLGKRIRTEAEITQVKVTDSKVHLQISGKPKSEFDYCISTMSPQLLAKKLEPNAHGRQLIDALERIHYVPSVKVGWQANKRFWETDDRIYGGISWTDHNISQIWYPSSGFFANKGVLTGAYNRGPPAVILGQKTHEQRLDVAIAGGKLMHGENFEKYIDKGRGLSIAWQHMPYQNGGWADHQAEPDHEDHDAYVSLNRHDPPFFLAGDYMSYMPGWIEGAFRSANLTVSTLAKYHEEMNSRKSKRIRGSVR